jgi:hypothetical protein
MTHFIVFILIGLAMNMNITDTLIFALGLLLYISYYVKVEGFVDSTNIVTPKDIQDEMFKGLYISPDLLPTNPADPTSYPPQECRAFSLYNLSQIEAGAATI